MIAKEVVMMTTTMQDMIKKTSIILINVTWTMLLQRYAEASAQLVEEFQTLLRHKLSQDDSQDHLMIVDAQRQAAQRAEVAVRVAAIEARKTQFYQLCFGQEEEENEIEQCKCIVKIYRRNNKKEQTNCHMTNYS
jgi:hypothetical protein